MEQTPTSSPKNTLRFPPLHIVLLLMAGIGVFAFLLYVPYPSVLGEIAGWLLGWGALPSFFAHHPGFYTFVQDVLRGFYVFTTISVLSAALFFFVYVLLDESLTQSHDKKGLLALTLRAVKPFILLQLVIGLVGTLVFWKIPSFTAVSWLPSFGTVSAAKASYTVGWELMCVLFSCAFALSEHWKTALFKAGNLLVSYPFFWLIFVISLWGLAFFPTWLLKQFGLPFFAGYLISGIFFQLAGLTVGLVALFGKFDTK